MAKSKGGTSRTLKWIALNGIWATILWLGTFQAVQWAENLFCFMAWVSAALWFVTIVFDEIHQNIYDKGQPVPVRVGVIYDIAIVLTLAAAGWFWTALACIFGSLTEYCIFDKPPESQAKGVEENDG